MKPCPTCGRGRQGLRRYWTPERIVDAIQEWVAEHGRTPRMIEWRFSGPSWPVNSTVIGTFGSWRAGIEAAGYECPPGKRKVAA